MNYDMVPPIVWVSCEEVGGKISNETLITYTPWRGFPAFYFPFESQPGYLPPLVALHLKAWPGAALTLRCSPWALNLPVGSGAVQFTVRLLNTHQLTEE